MKPSKPQLLTTDSQLESHRQPKSLRLFLIGRAFVIVKPVKRFLHLRLIFLRCGATRNEGVSQDILSNYLLEIHFAYSMQSDELQYSSRNHLLETLSLLKLTLITEALSGRLFEASLLDIGLTLVAITLRDTLIGSG